MSVRLRYSDPVKKALVKGRPIVALESTVIAHGLPSPTNLELARRLESIVLDHGAVPATICVLRGELRVGLSDAELVHLATGPGIRKASCRDLPLLVASEGDGATTVAATASIAGMAGISIFATGGIGGVHRHDPRDVSNDLSILASTPVAVVCSGAKAILDLPATLEWLEMSGVPVVGYGTDELPAFFSRSSGLPVPSRVDTPDAVARVVRACRELGQRHGVLVAVPVPAQFELSREVAEPLIAAGLVAAQDQRIEGSKITPFLLAWLARHSEGATLRANLALLENNAAVAALIAAALVRLAAFS